MDYAYQNEIKKVQNLIKKISDPEHPLSWIPLEYMTLEAQIEVIRRLLQDTERETMSYIKKIDADQDYGHIFRDRFICEEQDGPDFEYYVFDCRNKIRSLGNSNEVMGYLKAVAYAIEVIFYQALESSHQTNTKYLRVDYLAKYIDFVIDVICQTVIYQILTKDTLDKKEIMGQLHQRTERFDSFLNDLIIIEGERNDKELEVDILFLFIEAFIEHRNRIKEETQIFNTLQEEKQKWPAIVSEVPPEYIVAKDIVSEVVIDESEDIITEGIKYSAYADKLRTVREFIDIMKEYGGRNASRNSMMDIKVYFREIYVSKIKYKRQQAHTIVQNYVQKVKDAKGTGRPIPEFDSLRQSKFIREKITRGYYREINLLDAYYTFNEFRLKLYDLLLKIYYFCDVEEGIFYLAKILQGYIELLEHYL